MIKNIDKYILKMIIITGLMFMATLVLADSRHVAINMPDVNITNVSRGTSQGIALAISASQLHFDFGTFPLQGGVGIGSFNGSQAATFGLAKRFDRILINGTISGEEGLEGFGFGLGLNWRF